MTSRDRSQRHNGDDDREPSLGALALLLAVIVVVLLMVAAFIAFGGGLGGVIQPAGAHAPFGAV